MSKQSKQVLQDQREKLLEARGNVTSLVERAQIDDSRNRTTARPARRQLRRLASNNRHQRHQVREENEGGYVGSAGESGHRWKNKKLVVTFLRFFVFHLNVFFVS